LSTAGDARLVSGRLAVYFALLALVSVAAAFAVGLPAAVLCGWLALAQLTVAGSYFRGSATVFGKRPDGRLGWLSVLLLLPYLVFLSVFFHLKRWLKYGGLPCVEVAPRVWLGRRLLPQELPEVIDCVVDLTAEYREPREIVASQHYLCLPTLNRFVPSDDAMEELLTALVAEPGTLYIHCGSGKGRSAAVAAGVLVLRGLAGDVAEAEKILRRARPQVHLHPVQREQISRLCRRSA
jgi:protein-tyrosine phosphatase